MTHPPRDHLAEVQAATARILAHLASDEPKEYGADVEEPDDFDAMFPEDNAWASEAAARDMVWPVGS